MVRRRGQWRSAYEVHSERSAARSRWFTIPPNWMSAARIARFVRSVPPMPRRAAQGRPHPPRRCHRGQRAKAWRRHGEGMAEAWRSHDAHRAQLRAKPWPGRSATARAPSPTARSWARQNAAPDRCSTSAPSRSSSSHRPHFRRIVAIQAQRTAVDQHQQIEIAISVEIEVAPSSAVGRRARRGCKGRARCFAPRPR